MMAPSSEFIGMQTEIVESSNKAIIGLAGKIINETKSTFTIHTKNGKKIISKGHSSWKFENEQVINGNLITKRPEDRIKVKA
ncbi:MAG: ribonuclease P protein subunit [Thaumarchaeota archaeon]|nr:ribonuclease P protein subunit [Nitrososphaerota archaeon]